MGLVGRDDGDEHVPFVYGFEGRTCFHCGDAKARPAEIVMICYTDEPILMCQFHAKQLARKLLEDLCHLAGDRNG